MRVTIKVEGLGDVVRQLAAAHDAMAAKHVEKVLVAEGARPIRDEWKRLAPSKTGQLVRSIKARIGKRRGQFIASAYAAVGRHKDEAPYANVLLKGAKEHVITPKTKQALKFGGRVFKWVRHPGFKANDFTDKGIAAVQSQVESGIKDGLKSLIETAARR